MKYILTYVLLAIAIISKAQSWDANYILKREYKQTGANSNDLSKVHITVDYFDGLGRPIQSIGVGKSSIGTDVISLSEYDEAGRKVRDRLPYAGGSNGENQNDAVASQESFYTSNIVGMQSTDLDRPFSETLFEKSPLNRSTGLRQQGGKSLGSNVKYGSNDSDDVKKYSYTANADITQTISQSGTYPANRLYKVETTDENEKTSIQFIDSQGRLICKKVLNDSEELSTYYIYDDFGLLRAALQPEYQDEANAAKYAFLYNYDAFGRIITKKIPGDATNTAGVTDIVYDIFDRPVLSQDAGQKARATGSVWGFTKYDAFNRPIVTGEISSATDRAGWQSSVSANTAHHEEKTSLGLGYTLSTTTPSVTDVNVLKVDYYDDYSFPGAQSYLNTFSITTNSSVKAQRTGGRARMLNTGSTWLVNTDYYDQEYRPIQEVRALYDLSTLTTERVSTKYKYDLSSLVDQEETDQGSASVTVNSHLKTYEYDHADRLLRIKEKITIGSKSKEAYTAAFKYNVLGQLQSKWYHAYPNNGLKYRVQTNYESNIRGWMTSAKSFYQKEANVKKSFYAIDLSYANGSNYTNGNISKMLWSLKDENSTTKGLSFNYDKANRLVGTVSVDGYGNIEGPITYWKNGNIKTLQRAGAAVDNLTYLYIGNRLSSINDATGNNTGVKGGSNTFGYDGNGNMVTDNTRGATLIYNQLNLPSKVVVGSTTYNYDYDAFGIKHKYSSSSQSVKYAGSIEYDQNNAFQRIATSNGQVQMATVAPSPQSDTLRFDYYLTDHLGNVRTVFDEMGEVRQQTDYYPFGLSIARDNPAQTPANRNLANRYLYNGKELQTGSGFVDYGARMYMPELGRWNSVDGLAEKNHEVSSYSYVVNNPMSYIDPFGLDTSRADANVPVNAGDVILFERHAPETQSVGEATVKGRGYKTLSNAAANGKGIRRAGGGFEVFKVTEGNGKNFVDPFLLAIDTFYSLNLSGANNGDPNYYGGSGPGAAFAKLKLLPLGKVIPNAGGKIVTFRTNTISTYYRVYSANPNGGSFITKVAPKTQAIAREGLALNDEWNTATFIQEVIVPEGVLLQRSRALPAFGKRGGLEQFQILERDSRIIFKPGVPLN